MLLTHLIVRAHHTGGTVVGSVDGRARVPGTGRGHAVPSLILRNTQYTQNQKSCKKNNNKVLCHAASGLRPDSYLIPAGHGRRRLHLLGDDALLLLGGVVGAGGGHCLLLQLLGLGILAQILVRGGGAGGDCGGRDVGATEVGGCSISLGGGVGYGKWVSACCGKNGTTKYTKGQQQQLEGAGLGQRQE